MSDSAKHDDARKRKVAKIAKDVMDTSQETRKEKYRNVIAKYKSNKNTLKALKSELQRESDKALTMLAQRPFSRADEYRQRLAELPAKKSDPQRLATQASLLRETNGYLAEKYERQAAEIARRKQESLQHKAKLLKLYYKTKTASKSVLSDDVSEDDQTAPPPPAEPVQTPAATT